MENKRVILTETKLKNLVMRCVNEAFDEYNDMGDIDPVVAELADAIDADVEGIDEIGRAPYGKGRRFACGKAEYIVYDSEDDADEAAVEEVTSLIEDEGILPNLELSDFIDENWAEELAREEADYYTDEAVESGEIEEDDMDDYWSEQYNRIMEDPAGYLKDKVGRDLGKYLVDYNALDIDAMARECVNIDGAANSLARYDGKTIYLPSGAIAFRTN